jgi:hypothetical protein
MSSLKTRHPWPAAQGPARVTPGRVISGVPAQCRPPTATLAAARRTGDTSGLGHSGPGGGPEIGSQGLRPAHVGSFLACSGSQPQVSGGGLGLGSGRGLGNLASGHCHGLGCQGSLPPAVRPGPAPGLLAAHDRAAGGAAPPDCHGLPAFRAPGDSGGPLCPPLPLGHGLPLERVDSLERYPHGLQAVALQG